MKRMLPVFRAQKSCKEAVLLDRTVRVAQGICSIKVCHLARQMLALGKEDRLSRYMR